MRRFEKMNHHVHYCMYVEQRDAARQMGKIQLLKVLNVMKRDIRSMKCGYHNRVAYESREKESENPGTRLLLKSSLLSLKVLKIQKLMFNKPTHSLNFIQSWCI